MNDTPIRWKDDPQFAASTGIDLRQADAGVGPFNLGLMRANAFSAPLGLGWAPGVGLAVLAVGVGATAWLAGSDGDVPPQLPIDAPVAQLVVVAAPAVVPVAPVVQLPPVALVPTPSVAPRAPLPLAVVAVPEAPVPIAEPTPAGADVPRPVLDGLAAQMAEYDRARGLERVGHREAALAAYQGWLERWPDGRLVTEVQLARVQLLMALGRVVEADAAAAEVMPNVDSAGVRQQLASLRAEALSALDRCDEALLLVEALSDEDATAVRKRCRRR